MLTHKKAGGEVPFSSPASFYLNDHWQLLAISLRDLFFLTLAYEGGSPFLQQAL